MDPLTLIMALLIALLLASIFIWWQTSQRLQRLEEKGLSQEQLDALAQRLLDSDQRILASTTQTFGQLQAGLGQLFEATRRMLEVGKNISSLEDLLKPPKLRGGMGETLLGELLSQILPGGHFEIQHPFKSGERVDAAIRLGDGIVPVDAKFPLESFRRLAEAQDEATAQKERKEFVRAVKVHIDEIANKYILPDQGTYDFALMYIPAENVYYETIIKDEAGEGLFPYALQRKVIPVSPNSFYAYLQVIVRGLRGMRIEERAREIMDHLAQLQGDTARFREEFDKLGGHIQNAYKKYEDADRRLSRLEDKLLAAGEAPQQLELPSGDE